MGLSAALGRRRLTALKGRADRRVAPAMLAAALGVLVLACTSPRAQAYVYWTSTSSSGTVGRANLDGGGANDSFIRAGHPSFGLAVDPAHLYWTTSNGHIARANLDGTEADQAFIPDVNPAHLVVDGTYIYWTRFGTSIGRARLDGTAVDNNFIAGDEELGTDNMAPSNLAISGPYIYWLNDGRTIGRANLDGTGVIVAFIKNTGSDIATGLAVDGAHIYWTDQQKNTIGRANIDGSGVNPRFIAAGLDPFDIALDATHIYWSKDAPSAIGRANLDGTGVNQKFIAAGPGASLAVDGLGPEPGQHLPPPPPGPPAGKRGLKGTISLAFKGGRVKGYRVSMSGTVGSAGGIDTIHVLLAKSRGDRLYQSHGWDVELGPGDVKLDRAKASIAVNHPLGPGGDKGVIAFTINGRPKRAHFACQSAANRVTGTLNGTIRIVVGDEFFKTITVTHMRGTATGRQSAARGCPHGTCRPQSWLGAEGGPFRGRNVLVGATTTRPGGRRYDSLTIGLFEPTVGTPFTQISHILSTSGRKRLFNVRRALTGAKVSAPGGVMSGSLRLRSVGALKRRAFGHCTHGILSRRVKVVGGAITGDFDSIGKTVFDTNLNRGFGARPMLHRLTS
jgi:virginiamycin B lyase